MRGGVALAVSSLLLLAACAPPVNTANVTPETSPSASASSSPSASPTPPASLELASAAFHNGELGLAYAGVTLVAAGGTSPYRWTVSALPPGLTLGDDGSVTGTPTKTGTYALTATVADAAGSTASRRATITVYPAMRTTQVCSVKCQIGAGCTRCGGFGTIAGGMPPYRYAVVGGSVPQGMTWKGLSLTGPFPAGAFNLSVQITDALGAQTRVVGNWVIYVPAKINAGTPCSNAGVDNRPICTASGWTYSGGSPFSSPKLVVTGFAQYCDPLYGCQTPTTLPTGWSMTVSDGIISFARTGDCGTLSYWGRINFELIDTSQCATTTASKASLVVDLVNRC